LESSELQKSFVKSVKGIVSDEIFSDEIINKIADKVIEKINSNKSENFVSELIKLVHTSYN
jgi:hypothetical protein